MVQFLEKTTYFPTKTLSEKSRLYFGLPMVREFELSFLGSDCLTGIIKIGRGQSIPFDCKVLPF